MKTKSEAAKPGAAASMKKEDLELAHKIHVLAQLVYGQLVATHAWAAPRSVPLPCQVGLPDMFPGAWAVPAAWPCCP
jgi:hypothetical protein